MVSFDSTAPNPGTSCINEHLSDVSPSSFKFTHKYLRILYLNELKKLQTNKSTGLDMISAQLLKTAAPVISKTSNLPF